MRGKNGNERCSDEEFVELFHSSGGSVKELARMLNVDQRGVHGRRRRIEERTGKLLLSRSDRSPDYQRVIDEFPDWQHIEIKDGLIIGFSDAHLVPGEKSTAHRALLKLVSELSPVAVIDMGDLLDFSSIARHHRIGWDKPLRVKDELEWGGDCLEEIKRAGPKKMITKRLMGNHDQRYSGLMSNTRPEMEGVKGMSLADHIVGWPASWAVRVNECQLEMKHRWKSGIHAPWNNVMNAGISYATGHLHSQKVYPLTDLRGDRWGVDVGTLSSVYGPHFRYMEASPRNWRSGFTVFRFVKQHLRQPQLVRVVSESRGIVEYLDRDIQV